MFEAQSHQPSASLSSKSATITKQTLSSAPVIAAPQVSFGAVNTKLVKNAEVNNSQAMMDNIYDEYEEPSVKGSSVLTKRRKNAAESQLSGINEDLLLMMVMWLPTLPQKASVKKHLNGIIIMKDY